MTKYLPVEKKEDCRHLQRHEGMTDECDIDGKDCNGPDHPDCPLDELKEVK